MSIYRSISPILASLAIGLCTVSSSEARAGFIAFMNEAAFLAAAGSVTVESFEGSAGTNLTSLTTPNFQLQHTGSTFSVLSAPSPFGTFATDGVRYLEEDSAGFVNEFQFTGFAEPLAAFSLDITDYGDFGTLPLVLTINGTTPFTIATSPRPNGNLLYFGVVATGVDQITNVRLSSGDAIGIDRVSIAAVPEPSTLLILGTGIVLLIGHVRFRRPETT